MLIHSNNKPIKILGLGFVAHEICDYLRLENIDSECVDIDTALEHPCPSDYQYLIGAAKNTSARQRIVNWLDQHNLTSPSYIHPQSICAEKVELGQGVICYPFSLILNATLQNHIIIGPYCHIGHNSQIGTGTVLLPYSYVLGSSTTGKFTVLQTKSNLIDHVAITVDYVNILPGAMVTKDINMPGTYGGAPARFVNSQTSLTSNYFK